MSENQTGKDSTVTGDEDGSSRRGDAPTRRVIPRSRLLPAVAGLGVLAVSQPLLDLVGRQPQFLVAHRLAPLEVVLLGVAVVLVPLALFAVLALSVRRWWSGAALAVPVLLVLLHVGTRLEQKGWPVVLAASALSAVVVFLYLRHAPIQDLFRYLLVVPVAVLFYFFLLVPRAVLAGGDPSGDALALDVMNPVPVVLVVFDEFPLASLIDGEGELLAEQFPSFGRLARDGVWYRNAITVETRTTESIPAILSGSRVPDGLVPNASEHPKTVFTVLGESHDVDAVEPVTALCPEYLCTGAPAAGGPLRRWARLITDLAVVYGHLVVPSPWDGRLPPIDENWTGFAAATTTADSPDQEWDLMEAVGEAVEADRRADVSRFLAGLEGPTGKPFLRVAHLVLPHRPWEFLPDGTRHGQEDVEGYGGRGWGSDEFFVAQGWKRHLLQVGYADSVVGSILQRLDQEGLYESSLVVVVADHGVHFRPGVEDMRVTSKESVGSILPVPLFVKYPAGTDDAPPAGTIDDRRMETIDVAPTVFDVVAVDPEIDLDGRSLLGDHIRSESVLELRGEPFRVDARGLEKLAVAREKERWFPDGDPWALVPGPDIRSLIGRSLPTEDGAGLDVSITSGSPLPPLVEGRIDSTRPLSGDELVGLTADGELVAVTKVFGVEGGRARFSVLVDPDGEHRSPYRVWLLADGELVG